MPLTFGSVKREVGLLALMSRALLSTGFTHGLLPYSARRQQQAVNNNGATTAGWHNVDRPALSRPKAALFLHSVACRSAATQTAARSAQAQAMSLLKHSAPHRPVLAC
jgi:hypothetical protein